MGPPPLRGRPLDWRSAGALACALAMGLAACRTPTALRDGRPVLAELRFEGNRGLSDSELRSKIVTAPTSGFFEKTVRHYDADLFAIDQQRIERWYRQRGWFEAKVASSEVLADEEGRATLVVRIEEGRRARVSELLLLGVEELSREEADGILAALPLRRGDAFDEGLYERSKASLEAQLEELGFAEAEAGGEVRVDLAQAEARVELQARPGKRFTFGRVSVTGNRGVSDEEIVRATGIERGAPFRQSRLALAQQRVYNLGTFSGVRVGLEPLGDAPVAAVRVNVREAPFETVRLGLGLQFEEARTEVPRVRAEYINRSFFGGIRRLELSTTVGYAFTPSITRADRTGLTNVTSAQLTLPNVLTPGLDFVTRLDFSRVLQSGFRYSAVGARTGFVFRWGRHAVSPALNFVQYFDASLDLDLGSLLDQGATAGANVGLLNNCIPACTLTYPELRYTYDSRNSALEPTEGFYATAALAQTLKPGSFTYLRFEPEVRGYLTLGPVVLAGRAAYGALILPPGSDFLDSPFTQRFFGGGQSWQRGYAPLRQGPKVGADYQFRPGFPLFSEQYASRAVPVGGNGAILLSAEARIRTDFLLRGSALVPFVDASRVSRYFEVPLARPLEVAPGLGLRYYTPFGPVRLDVAWLLNPQDVLAASPGGSRLPTPVSTACSGGYGCVAESRLSYHLSLGEAF